MFLAAFLDPALFAVTIYEKNKSLGRKFLVAGDGGFNLTHTEPLDALVTRYTPPDFLAAAIHFFDNQQFGKWLAEIGIPTFVGSSKRVYPVRGIKPIGVLNAVLAVLAAKGVQLRYQYPFTGWNAAGEPIFKGNEAVSADYYVFALGGGSWSVTGSDGHWLEAFRQQGIATRPFAPANCAYQVPWPAGLLAECEGQPLKNITITCAGQVQKGEAVLTQFGLEGNAIYGLSPQIQAQLDARQAATIYLDLKPTLSLPTILQRLAASNKKTTDTLRTDLRLSPTQLALLKHTLTKTDYLSATTLAARIKQLPLQVTGAAPLDEAISTSGGVALTAVSAAFALTELPHTYCIGEMLDWNAPTGGYLIQACASMAAFLAEHLKRQATEAEFQD